MATPDPTPSARPFRVLIVDDSELFRRVAREVLEYRGYRVVGEADSARTAIAAVAALAPDGALIDVGLPDAPGTELAAYLLTHQPGVAVLLCTADPEFDPKPLTNLYGAAGFVLKHKLTQVDLGAFWPLCAA